jgi:hypothetical protein
MAGTSVGGGSLALSRPSSTRTKRNPSPLSSYLSILDNSTFNCANVSHRLLTPLTGPPALMAAVPLESCSSPSCGGNKGGDHSSASATEETMRSKRWRDVMHWPAETMAWRRRRGLWRVMLRRREVVTAVLPVASTPWMVRLRHGAAEGYDSTLVR